MRLGNCTDFLHVKIIDIDTIIWANGTLGNCQIRVKHQLWVNLEPAPQASTNRAGALGGIVAKKAWLKFWDFDIWVIQRSVALAQQLHIATIGIKHAHNTATDIKCLLDALGHTATHIRGHHQPINNNFYTMAIILF